MRNIQWKYFDGACSTNRTTQPVVCWFNKQKV